MDEVRVSTAVRRVSLVDEAYTAIRAMIIDGKIPPGSRMTVRPIADQLDLSATPIKAALVTLEREGVLVSKLHRGFFVPELSIDDMREIYEMREALDRLAGRRAAASAEHAAIAMQLRANCEEQRGFLESNDVDEYRRSDIDFHRNLWSLCGNNRLLRMAEQLMDQMKLGNSLSARLPGRVTLSLSEHLAIVEAIEQGDIERAESAAGEHINSVRRTFMESIPDREGDAPIVVKR
ncbi:MAG: GntR family transcriptional regulator [Lacisediminihabitans sp.]